jgi:very-short-patch-repair endonuclease
MNKHTLLIHARELRRRSTDAESKLWYHLRSRRLAGYRFRRQQPFGRRIVDFYCREGKLVIELDGGQHALAPQSRADAMRDEEFELRGFRVLRFWNGDVMRNIDGVLKTIAEALESPSP